MKFIYCLRWNNILNTIFELWTCTCLIFRVLHSVDHCLSFFGWPLCFLSFFDFRNLITSLVSSNFSCRIIRRFNCQSIPSMTTPYLTKNSYMWGKVDQTIYRGSRTLYVIILGCIPSVKSPLLSNIWNSFQFLPFANKTMIYL